jgi:predicted DNA-binding protein
MDKKMPGPAPKRGERLTQVSTRIPISLKARLVEQAAAEGRPASDLMVEALEAKVGNGETEQ